MDPLKKVPFLKWPEVGLRRVPFKGSPILLPEGSSNLLHHTGSRRHGIAPVSTRFRKWQGRVALQRQATEMVISVILPWFMPINSLAVAVQSFTSVAKYTEPAPFLLHGSRLRVLDFFGCSRTKHDSNAHCILQNPYARFSLPVLLA